jgi:hypothetical protein
LPADLELSIEPPFGFGLEIHWASQTRFSLRPGHSTRLGGLIQALRPDEVNLGKPWPLACYLSSSRGQIARLSAEITVPDSQPAAIYYVLTQDCETFDGGEKTGDYRDMSILGNRNNFMDPEDYRIQMIEKPNSLNRVAEKHGACWTHFWTATQRFAAEWAANHSQTGAWLRIIEELDQSIRDGSRRHEYAPHIHFDFEPDSKLPPQPRLLYDPTTDGLLPNEYYDSETNPDHKYHGWDGARKGIAYVKREGDLTDLDSKVGSLGKSVRYLSRLSFGGKHSLITRTGACDFGETEEDLEISARALMANAILANADAGLYENVGGHPRGRQIYFCRRDNLEAEIESLEEASLVQLHAPEIQLEGATLEGLNSWFDRRMKESAGAGVRAIVAMTHAMFMKGEPDPYRNTAGGDFENLDRHLEYVKKHYSNIRFATASEVVLEFLDYYSPTLRAVVTRPRLQSIDGEVLIYPIHILGRGIPVSESRPIRVTVQAPSIFNPGEVKRLTILENHRPIARGEVERGRLSQIEFFARGREGYELEVRTERDWVTSLGSQIDIALSPSARYEELPEEEGTDLFRLRRPAIIKRSVAREDCLTEGDSWDWVFPKDLFRLLTNPIDGGEDPVGRRLHPFAFISLGAALHAALEICGPGLRPARTEIRWLRPISGASDFRLHCKLRKATARSITFESRFFETETEAAQVLVALSRE